MGENEPDDGPWTSRDSTKTIKSLQEKYDITDKYRKPASFSDNESRFNKGKYPPDWDKNRSDIDDAKGGRREAIIEYQDYKCGRCRADIRSGGHCHHYRPISEGGTHELQNLVALCTPCHKLIHPNVSKLDGDWREATLFPSVDADPRVATIRKVTTPAEREQYLPQLELLELTSVVGENTFATSDATYATSPTDAIEASENLDGILENVGLTPNQNLLIRVINAQHSPLREADVELEIQLGGHGSYTTEETTNKHGEAHFTIPESDRAHATVEKDEFESSSIDIPTKSKPFETEVKLELAESGTTSAPPEPGGSGGSGSRTSRRAALALGVGLLGGMGIYRYLPTELNGESENNIGGDTQAEGGTSGSSSAELTEGWSFDSGTSAAIQSIKTVEDRIYTNTKTGSVIALSSAGEQQWTADLRAKSTESLVYVDNQIVVPSESRIQAFEADTGDIQWEFEVLSSSEMPLISAGVEGILTVLGNGEEGITEMVSIDTDSGDERWRTEIISNQRPVSTNDLICVPYRNGIEFYNRSGELDKTVSFSEFADRASELNIVGNRGYVYTGETDDGFTDSLDGNGLHAVDIQSKVHLWKADLGLGYIAHGEEILPPSVEGGQIFQSFSSSINTVDNSGVISWDKDLEGNAVSGPLVTNDSVYVGLDGRDQHSIQGLNKSTGEMTSVTTISQPVVAMAVVDDNIIAGTDRGVIREFGLPG